MAGGVAGEQHVAVDGIAGHARDRATVVLAAGTEIVALAQLRHRRLQGLLDERADAGADVIAIGANTMHKMAQQVMASVRLPLIHIGDALAKELKADARSRPLLLGTRYTMEDPFLIDHLGNKGIGAVTPDKADRDALHAIIYDQLIKGVVTDQARDTVRAMIDRSSAKEADSVVFACTEIGMLFPPTEAGLPGYDTLEIHAAALVDFSLA